MTYKLQAMVALLLSSQLAFAGFGSFGKKEESSGSGNAQKVQTELVNEYKTSLVKELEAKSLILEALGDKEASAKLKTEAEAFASSGIQGVDALKNAINTSEGSDKAVEEQMAKTEGLDKDSAKKFSEGIASYGQAVYFSKDLLPKLSDFSTQASKEIKAAGFTGAKKAKDQLGVGLYMSSKLPSHYINLATTGSKFVKWGESKGVETPKEASSSFDI